MPIAELLGMQFDMQLLGKLTLSVATILFVSLVFRFYNSRARNRRQSRERIQQRDVQTTRGSYSACNTEQEPQSKAAKEKSDRENHFQEFSEKPLQESLKNANSALKRGQPETMGLDSCVKEEPAGKGNIIEDITEAKSGKPKLTLKLPGVTETGPGIPSGRRSPVLMKKLEGVTGVGRQLRQDIGHQGMFSSFQSKAEVKVENADLILDGPGSCKKGIHGKIYEYYVESSSHFISDLSPTRSVSPVYGQNRNSTSQSLDLPGFKDCSRSPSPQPPSIIIRDLEIAPRISNEPPSTFKPETVRYSRQAVIHQDSYRTAASDSELPIPLPTQRALTPHSCSPAQPNDIPSSPLDSDIANLEMPEEPQVKTVAGAKFLHFPENMGNAELESLVGKLDLGNCLEALTLAKKHGNTALQQAALRVMSDNYLEVLRDPGLFGWLKAGERDHIQTQRMRGRKWLVVADMDSPDWSRRPSQSMYLESESVKSSSIYYYDDFKDTWHLHTHIPQEVLSKGCAICTMDNYLFIAVGFQGSDREATPSKKVYCYNPMTSIWSEISPMNEARPHCKLVALQGHLYAIGGECLSTVERYDPRTNRWTFVAPLPNETFAVAHKATACNGELFVAGGTLRYTLLRYNPKTNTWRESMTVGSKDKTTEMVAVKNFLYRFDVSPLGISVYRFHAVARLWYECSSLRLPHCTAFQCVTMDNIIYCVSRQFTLRFLADEVLPSFVAQDLKVLSLAKGILFPFVLVLPDRTTQQTCV
ncbi:kelch domain-containing protein 7A-like [Carassius carassius]|uniref:kelch domain-containing protein 7A-like n=1 Tax=Carassius carassius TaxID=217509 RepID=UPI0028692893|nr:kelch domain-containing protein 7A-like [Carassius carassius]